MYEFQFAALALVSLLIYWLLVRDILYFEFRGRSIFFHWFPVYWKLSVPDVA